MYSLVQLHKKPLKWILVNVQCARLKTLMNKTHDGWLGDA